MAKASLEWISAKLDAVSIELEGAKETLAQVRDTSRSNKQTLQETIGPAILELSNDIQGLGAKVETLKTNVDKAEGAIEATRFWGAIVGAMLTLGMSAIGLVIFF